MWITLLLLIASFIGLIWFTSNDVAQSQAASDDTVRTTQRTGKQDATVSLVEYSDFQCVACAAYYPVVEQVIEKYKDRISFEYRHYPLTALHRNAFAAARASEAAGKQGKFWEMYRLLFNNQPSWSESGNAPTIFEGYARQLGLNANTYKIDFASSETNGVINASIKEFNSLGLPKSTPTFILNGKRIEVRNNVEDFSRLIDEQLALSADAE